MTAECPACPDGLDCGWRGGAGSGWSGALCLVRLIPRVRAPSLAASGGGPASRGAMTERCVTCWQDRTSAPRKKGRRLLRSQLNVQHVARFCWRFPIGAYFQAWLPTPRCQRGAMSQQATADCRSRRCSSFRWPRSHPSCNIPREAAGACRVRHLLGGERLVLEAASPGGSFRILKERQWRELLGMKACPPV